MEAKLKAWRHTFTVVVQAHDNADVLYDCDQGERPKDDGNSAQHLFWSWLSGKDIGKRIQR